MQARQGHREHAAAARLAVDVDAPAMLWLLGSGAILLFTRRRTAEAG